jgi:hypothetical protein
LGLAVPRSPDDAATLERYFKFVRESCDDVIGKRHHIIDATFIDHGPAMGVLVSKRLPAVLEWLETWLTAHPTLPNIVLHSPYPLTSLCQALLPVAPEPAMKLWSRLEAAQHAGVIKSSDLPLLPLSAPDGNDGDAARERVLNAAITDKDLAELALSAKRQGKVEWLEGVVQRDALAAEPWKAARAYTLLGFSDSNSSWDAIWSDLETSRPSGGWLSFVFENSLHSYRRNIWARHWFERFTSATEPVDIFAGFELLAGSIDGRASDWISETFTAGMIKGEKARHFRANTARLNNMIKGYADQRKKTLFWTNIMEHTHAPWL